MLSLKKNFKADFSVDTNSNVDAVVSADVAVDLNHNLSINNSANENLLRSKLNFSYAGKIILVIFAVLAVLILMTSSAYATIDSHNSNLNSQDDIFPSMDEISVEDLRDKGLSTYGYADNQVSTKNTFNQSELPRKFDMREHGWVSKVRFQNPIGSCWAFAIIAAAEASIQHDLKESGQEVDDVDMSEHHLAWFEKNNLPDTGDFNGQNGEGFHTDDPSSRMNGGFPYDGIVAFSSGQGIVDEQTYPYIGKNGWVQGDDKKTYESKEACEAAGVTPFCYSYEDDWSLDESGRSSQVYPLKEGNFLSDFMVNDGTGKYVLDQSAVNVAKNEICNGRALAMSYKDDQAKLPGMGTYMNVIGTDPSQKIFNHYTWEKVSRDHCVCIVGYDDDYAKENFSIDPIEKDKNGHELFQLTGKELKNDDNGKPYYCNNKQEKFNVDTNNELWVTNTKKKDERGYDIYKLTTNKLENNDEGYPLIPGTTDPLPGLPQNPNDSIIKYAHSGTTHTPEGNGAWIVKNSWGAASQDFPNHFVWGNNGEGYFYVSYYDLTTSFVESYKFATSNEEKELYDSDTCYQYDYMNALGLLDDQTSSLPMYTSNTYTAKEPCTIKSISTVSGKPESTVNLKLYLLNDKSENPTDGTLAAEANATYDLAGYHRINLPNSVKVEAGQKYSVVVEENINVASNNDATKNWYYSCAINAKYAEPTDKGKYTNAVVNTGESTLGLTSKDGNIEWIDWKAYQDDPGSPINRYIKLGWIFDNYPIKAFADYMHSVTCTASEGGSIYADQSMASQGEVVTLNAPPDAGYYLSSLTATDVDGNSIPIVNNQFTMPDSDVKVHATFSIGEDPSKKVDPYDSSLDPGDDSTSNDNYSNAATTGDNTSTFAILCMLLILMTGGTILYRRFI